MCEVDHSAAVRADPKVGRDVSFRRKLLVELDDVSTGKRHAEQLPDIVRVLIRTVQDAVA